MGSEHGFRDFVGCAGIDRFWWWFRLLLLVYYLLVVTCDC